MADEEYDHNVFAVLSGTGHFASLAIKLEYNSKWFRPAGEDIVATRSVIGSREPTPEYSPGRDIYYPDRLVITFDQLLKNAWIQFGTDTDTSDILLDPGTPGADGQHYIISIDDQLAVFLTSISETAVEHDGQNKHEARSRESWILAYPPGSSDVFKETTIVSGFNHFSIEFPNHKAAHPEYTRNLKAYMENCKQREKEAEIGTFRELALGKNGTTVAPSESQKPKKNLIYHTLEEIGRGRSSTVHRIIRMNDGKQFAIKLFNRWDNKRKLDEDPDEWWESIEREYTLMRDHPHPNVMEVFELFKTPNPRMLMALYTYGSILDVDIVNEERFITALGQALDGVSHLHSRKIVHRDLKPQNFLVEFKPMFKIVISDFGLAKVRVNSILFSTLCGTPKYVAPEIFSYAHGPPVDVWSLGVIGLEWIHGFLQPLNPPGPMLQDGAVAKDWTAWVNTWSSVVLQQLYDHEDRDRIVEILYHMLRIDATERWPASRCLEAGFRNGIFDRRESDGLVVCTDDLESPISGPPADGHEEKESEGGSEGDGKEEREGDGKEGIEGEGKEERERDGEVDDTKEDIEGGGKDDIERDGKEDWSKNRKEESRKRPRFK
ncbi:hypothetical protein FQN57_004328 [Myotisia sp. PD_48]|nr:hypothetical protein FQN57_004328 [Myotisia sp. PD_48]